VNVKLVAAGSAAALALCGAGAAVAAGSAHQALGIQAPGNQAQGSEAAASAFDAAVAYLQIDKQTLAQDLRSGQSLAQVAEAQGKTVDGLVDAVVNAAQAQLDVAVAAGKLSSANEQALLTKLRTSLGVLVGKSFGGARVAGTPRPRPVTMFLQPLLSKLRLHLGIVPNSIVPNRPANKTMQSKLNTGTSLAAGNGAHS
jgi:hypothetical protein